MARIKKLIYDNSLLSEAILLANVDSTNNFCKNLIINKTGAFVWARKQKKGRGSFGRSWQDFGQANIYLSICLDPNRLWPKLYQKDQNLVNQIMAMLPVLVGSYLADTLTNIYGLKVGLKWPNDLMILLENRRLLETVYGHNLLWQIGRESCGHQDPILIKIGGILCESLSSGKQMDRIIIGVGINRQLNILAHDDPEYKIRHVSLDDNNSQSNIYYPKSQSDEPYKPDQLDHSDTSKVSDELDQTSQLNRSNKYHHLIKTNQDALTSVYRRQGYLPGAINRLCPVDFRISKGRLLGAIIDTLSKALLGYGHDVSITDHNPPRAVLSPVRQATIDSQLIWRGKAVYDINKAQYTLLGIADDGSLLLKDNLSLQKKRHFAGSLRLSL